MKVDKNDASILMIDNQDTDSEYSTGKWYKESINGKMMITLKVDNEPYLSIRYPSQFVDPEASPSEAFMTRMVENWNDFMTNPEKGASLICRVAELEFQLQVLTDVLLENKVDVEGIRNGQVRTPEAKENSELSQGVGNPEENDVGVTG